MSSACCCCSCCCCQLFCCVEVFSFSAKLTKVIIWSGSVLKILWKWVEGETWDTCEVVKSYYVTPQLFRAWYQHWDICTFTHSHFVSNLHLFLCLCQRSVTTGKMFFPVRLPTCASQNIIKTVCWKVFERFSLNLHQWCGMWQKWTLHNLGSLDGSEGQGHIAIKSSANITLKYNRAMRSCCPFAIFRIDSHPLLVHVLSFPQYAAHCVPDLSVLVSVLYNHLLLTYLSFGVDLELCWRKKFVGSGYLETVKRRQ